MDLFSDIYFRFGNKLIEDNMNDFSVIDVIEGDVIPLKNDKVMTFLTEKYLENILDSYKNDVNNIFYQLKIDFPRTCIYVNNKRFFDYDEFRKKISQYDKHKVSRIRNHKLSTLLMMLCNQSSFAYPYELIYKLYSDSSHHVVSDGTIITFELGNKSISVQLHMKLNIININIEGCNVEDKLNVIIYMDIYLDGNKANFGKYNLLIWS